MLHNAIEALQAAKADVVRIKDFGALLLAEIKGEGFIWATELPEAEDTTARGHLLLEAPRLALAEVIARTAENISWDSRMNHIRAWLDAVED